MPLGDRLVDLGGQLVIRPMLQHGLQVGLSPIELPGLNECQLTLMTDLVRIPTGTLCFGQPPVGLRQLAEPAQRSAQQIQILCITGLHPLRSLKMAARRLQVPSGERLPGGVRMPPGTGRPPDKQGRHGEQQHADRDPRPSGAAREPFESRRTPAHFYFSSNVKWFCSASSLTVTLSPLVSVLAYFSGMIDFGPPVLSAAPPRLLSICIWLIFSM